MVEYAYRDNRGCLHQRRQAGLSPAPGLPMRSPLHALYRDEVTPDA